MAEPTQKFCLLRENLISRKTLFGSMRGAKRGGHFSFGRGPLGERFTGLRRGGLRFRITPSGPPTQTRRPHTDPALGLPQLQEKKKRCKRPSGPGARRPVFLMRKKATIKGGRAKEEGTRKYPSFVRWTIEGRGTTIGFRRHSVYFGPTCRKIVRANTTGGASLRMFLKKAFNSARGAVTLPMSIKASTHINQKVEGDGRKSCARVTGLRNQGVGHKKRRHSLRADGYFGWIAGDGRKKLSALGSPVRLWAGGTRRHPVIGNTKVRTRAWGAICSIRTKKQKTGGTTSSKGLARGRSARPTFHAKNFFLWADPTIHKNL